MKQIFKKLVIFFSILAVLAMAGAGAVLYWLVVVEPGHELELSYIESILGRESPVYYRDGNEKIGVLFQEAHRQYLPYNQIPRSFVNAIIAAEDDQFFHHIGIDFFGIARAMIANIKAGRIIQGGSTITQQTAKNLFKRESRTYRAKLKELLYALRLEYHYPKEKILEFYVNQFFVSGNGHGLGVAARYYFDKEVNELTLLENAFIAGSVKRPNYYNPFTKLSEAAADKARKRANERAAYVLRNMRRLDYITQREYEEAIEKDISFSRGRMSFALNTIMDLVRDGLSTPEISGALEEHGISNPSTSGIRIFTTVDKEIQDKSMEILRSELSRLDTRLRGYDRKEVQAEYAALEYAGETVVKKGAFLFGRIRAVESDIDGKPLVKIDLGAKLPEGVIDDKGLEKILTALVRYTRQRWSTADRKDIPMLLSQLQKGDRVYVQVQSVEDDGTSRLVLERFPELQGAALVLQEGVIRAMVGGSENRFFNRAISAKRLMGSTFKPFLFSAALQLGWSPTDLLKNTRDVFVYQDIPYFPRPDHVSPHEYVSLSWTGVNSENLAAIWLVYHLTDHLTPPRLHEVAVHLGLAPQVDETSSGRYEYFKQLIRDRYGIIVDRDTLLQAAYDSAVKNLEADFLFAGRGVEYSNLKNLPYGLHFDRFAEEVTLKLEEEEGKEELSKDEKDELELRLAILERSYLGLQPSLEAFKQSKQYFEVEVSPATKLDPLALLDSESGNLKPVGLFWQDENGNLVFSLMSPAEGWSLVSEKVIRERLRDLDSGQREDFWGNVMLEGRVSMYTLQQLNEQMVKEKERLFAVKPYSMEVLSDVRDYRILIGLQYLMHLADEMGVQAQLEPVLSFPLGSNVISLLDGVRMYESMVTGTEYSVTRHTSGKDTFYSESSADGLLIIDRIETVDGQIIYSLEKESKKVVDTLTAVSVADILRNTVAHGTGRHAHQSVRLRSTDSEKDKLLQKLNLPVPLLGKTGTANEFRNAAFFGYVPVLSETESVMQLPGGYSLGVYVGFDDNRSMKKGTTNITGAGGALPTWSNIAEEVLFQEKIGDRVDIADISFNGLPLRYAETGQVFVPVSPGRGGIAMAGRGALKTPLAPSIPSVLAYGHVGATGSFEPVRVFKPFWKNQ